MNILVVSLHVGGGHRAAMHSLLRALQRFAPEVQATSFISSHRALEHLHRFAYTNAQVAERERDAAQQRAYHNAAFVVQVATQQRSCSALSVGHG